MSRGYQPAFEVLEVDGREVLAVDLPGVDARGVRFSVEDEVLVVSGARLPAPGHRVAGARPSGSFELRFPLAAGVTRDQLCVEFSNGVLEVELRPLRLFDVEHPSTRVGIAGRAIPLT